MSNHEERIQQIITQFDIPGSLKSLAPLKRGHINETFVSRWIQPNGSSEQFIHQWINGHVFRNVPALMANIAKVTQHIARKLPTGGVEKTLEVVGTKVGTHYIQDSDGEYWRTYRFVAGTQSFAVCQGLRQAHESARIMGRFHNYLADLPADRLVDTIPFFHHTPRRYQAFERSLVEDVMRRKEGVSKEIDFALERQALAGQIVEGIELQRLPLRVIHNDMKLNNILFDQTSGDAVCLVDLDTVMGGSPLYDFGDLVRNVSIPTDEDEVDLSRISVDLQSFDALVSGYAECVGKSLCAEELELLPIAPRIMALTLGVRFLNDYVDGDHYFKIHKPEHNLIRARAQFRVVKSMEQEEAAMRSIVEKHFSPLG
jgi:Ser/Thr protein kinase RdoA (MazF antagonist)